MRTCIKQKEGDLTLKCSGECGLEKPATIEHFYWRTDLKIWRRKCRMCMREVKREACARYRRNNLEKDRERHRNYNRTDHSKKRIAEWAKKNPEKTRAAQQKYYKSDKGKINQQKYREINKEKYLLRCRLYAKKLRENEEYKLRSNISHSVYFHLRKLNSSKNGSSISKYLPYTIKELKQHLESQFEPWMNWNNWGVYRPEKWDDNDTSTWVWQIDHIIPCSTLPYISMEDENFKKCWDLSNLRPYSAKQNILDGRTRVRHNLIPENQT